MLNKENNYFSHLIIPVTENDCSRHCLMLPNVTQAERKKGKWLEEVYLHIPPPYISSIWISTLPSQPQGRRAGLLFCSTATPEAEFDILATWLPTIWQVAWAECLLTGMVRCHCRRHCAVHYSKYLMNDNIRQVVSIYFNAAGMKVHTDLCCCSIISRVHGQLDANLHAANNYTCSLI